ncbi:uncharacterized protein LOC117170190 [Belonocnema kinseyi]|uniref:uncharacterized protein LOC117170190 n=1 Tax=Belonocnema kinseyi TaxID=2817044 RepID=UPI00143DF372|nr:uncharacterized protein LOC117170190 [Belonocnema kinseyi]
MKTRLILQISWLLLLIAASSKGTFFQYPKKALADFFHSFKDKKEGKRMLTNVHHLHLHYYPTPVQVFDTKPFQAPDKTHLDKLHSESLTSMGWTDQEFPIPDPKIIFPSNIQDGWPNPHENSRKMWNWDNELFETNRILPVPFEHQPVLVQVPFHQQIVFQQPAAKEEKKLSLLTAFFQKLRRIKDALFHVEKPHDDCEDRKSEATITNKVNGHVNSILYVNSKMDRKV